jgi:hypothetical protein
VSALRLFYLALEDEAHLNKPKGEFLKYSKSLIRLKTDEVSLSNLVEAIPTILC